MSCDVLKQIAHFLRLILLFTFLTKNNHLFRNINFLLVIGNPIEKMYERLVKKYNGRVVGIRKSHTKLIDNKYYDVKEYEVFREDYLKTRGEI